MAKPLSKSGIAALLGRGVTFNGDGLITFHGSDFLKEPRFQRAYQTGIARSGSDPNVEWRVRVALWAGRHAIRLEGDFVECGTNTGILAGAILEDLDWAERRDRRFYLLDTFCGIPVEELSQSSAAAATVWNETYSDVYEKVHAFTRRFPNVEMVRGIIPGTLDKVQSERIAYLSVDLNVPEPEMAVAAFFWPKLVPGAVVLLDDYNYRGYETQRAAWNEFASRMGIDILPLPTGQGVIIKPPG